MIAVGRRQPTTALTGEAVAQEGQYTLSRILTIWAAAALPMAILGWIVAPAVGSSLDLGVGEENREAFTRAAFLMVGMIWQFALVMFIVRREEGDLRWATIQKRCWLNTPRDPATGRAHRRLWWWLVPLFFGYAVLQFVPFQAAWEALFPFLGEPDKYSFTELMASDSRKEALDGAWQLVGLFVVLGIFNTIIGEELLFRGILLPKMNGVFGRRDWAANGVLFGLYHLHQPWTIVGSMVKGTFFYALPSKRFQSVWMGIAIHSIQTILFIFISLGLVLGLA